MPAELLPAPAPSACGQPGLTSSLSRRLPSLDGWRALSILLVLGSHCIYATGFPREFRGAVQRLFDGNPGDGNLGVRFFFTISGFLITWLLLQEWKTTQTISLSKFYLRRGLRILPVYLAFLVTIYLLGCFSDNYPNGRSWAGCLTFTRNTFGTDPITAHLWSLSVEEQFYLFWPSVLILLLAKSNSRGLIVTVMVLALLTPLFQGATQILPEYPTAHLPATPLARLAFFAIVIAARFFSYADALAFGCLAAILLAYKGHYLRSKLTDRPGSIGAIALACILIPYFLDHLLKDPPITCAQFNNTLQAAGFSILILQSVFIPQATFYRVLNWKPIVLVGVLSYSIYIWQQLIWPAPKIAGLDHIWWLGLWIPPLLAIATVSYYAMELPLAKMRNAFRPKAIE